MYCGLMRLGASITTLSLRALPYLVSESAFEKQKETARTGLDGVDDDSNGPRIQLLNDCDRSHLSSGRRLHEKERQKRHQLACWVLMSTLESQQPQPGSLFCVSK